MAARKEQDNWFLRTINTKVASLVIRYMNNNISMHFDCILVCTSLAYGTWSVCI